jgi:glycosyltransferase involved in cell wall biosynthesis
VSDCKKISVFFIGPLPPPLGGIATYCEDYLRTNLPSEFDITFCQTMLIKGAFGSKGLIRLVLRCFNSFAVMVMWIWRLMCKHPDIAHIPTNSYAGFYEKSVLVFLARIFGVRTAIHIHGGGFKDFYTGLSGFKQKTVRFLLNLNFRVIVLSKEWQFFFESIGISSDRIVVLTNSVFIPDIPAHNKNAGETVVLFMSRLEKQKGIYELIDVIKRRNEKLSSCRYILAGPKTSEWPEISNRIADAGLSDNIDIPGPLVGKDKEEAYQNADIYVLQSYTEGMPIGLLEAMSYGLVCITTPVGGIPRVVQNMHNGILVEPGNADALENALEYLIANPELRDKLGKEARKTVSVYYNWEKRADEIKKLYLEMAQKN